MSARRIILASALALAACFGAAAQTVPQLGAPSQADFLVPPMLPLLQAISAGGGSPQVLLDNNPAVASFNSNPTSPKSNTGLTVGSAANRCAVVTVSIFAATFPTTVTATVGGVSAPIITSIQDATDEIEVLIFGMVAPASGAQTVTVAFTGVSTVGGIAIGATSFSGCSQTGGTTTFANAVTASGSTATPTLAVTNPSGDVAINVGNSADSFNVPSGTLLWTDAANTGGGAQFSSAVNPTLTWTTGGASGWVMSAASIAHN